MKRGQRRTEDIDKKKCQYFIVFFALLKAMNLFHLYKKITLLSCDVSLECAAIL